MSISEKILHRLRRALGIVSPSLAYLQEEPQPAPALKIAFLGYNARHTTESMLRFAVDNADQVKRFERHQGRIVLKDGTEITAIRTPADLQRRHFDQAIIADDHRGAVYELYVYLTDGLCWALSASIVPREYWYQIYDLDAEVPQNDV